MKSKAFTIVELLGTIVILSILILLAVPAYNKVIESVRSSQYNTKIEKSLGFPVKYSAIASATISSTEVSP